MLRRPAVDRLDPGPRAHLEVRARIAALDERVPPAGVDGRHDLARAADHVGHDPDDRRQFRDPQGEREPGVDQAEGEARRATTSTDEEQAPGRRPEGRLDGTEGGDRDRPRDGAADDRLDADPAQTAKLEMREPAIEDREQGDRLDPRRDRDGERDPGQPERADEDDRERAVDRDRGDRRGDRRHGVLAGIERPGEDRDQGVGRQPDEEPDQRHGDQVEVRGADVAAAEQDLDDRPRARPRSTTAIGTIT